MKTVGLLLAAGRSSRMPPGHHKLLAEFDHVPLVRRSAEMMLRSELTSVTVVSGHRHSEIEDRLRGLPLDIRYNPRFADGIGTSLAHGFMHLPVSGCDGVLIMLADMPQITADHIDELLHVFRLDGGSKVVRGADGDKPGHPVIVPPALFADMRRLKGDDGAKAVLQEKKVPVRLIDLGKAALKDVDTAEELASAGGLFSPHGAGNPA